MPQAASCCPYVYMYLIQTMPLNISLSLSLALLSRGAIVRFEAILWTSGQPLTEKLKVFGYCIPQLWLRGSVIGTFQAVPQNKVFKVEKTPSI